MDNYLLTDIQLTILLFLYRFRFLTSIQLQKLLNHKTPRLTNYHLKILTSKNYINKHYTRTLGLGNLPAVYFLAPGSINVLHEKNDIPLSRLKKIYKEKTRSKQFIDHALLIAEYYLFLQNDSIKINQTLHFFTKSDLLSHQYIIHPLPDAYFARINENKETKRYFVEVVEENAPRFALRKRIDQYNDYIEDGKFEEATSHPFPSILFICPTVGIMIYLKKHLARVYEELSFDDVSIYVATREGVFVGRWEKVDAEEE
jgi:hypothetical protein